MSRSDFARNFAIGFGCCLGMVAVAAVAALAVINTGGDARTDAQSATPTARQLMQALEFMSRDGVTGVSSSGGASSGGGGAGAQPTSTPEMTPGVPLGGGGTSSPQTTNNVTSATTPQPTTTSSGSSSIVAPTPVTFVPPTIVPIQPLAVPTVSSAGRAPAGASTPVSAPLPAGGTPTTGR